MSTLKIRLGRPEQSVAKQEASGPSSPGKETDGLHSRPQKRRRALSDDGDNESATKNNIIRHTHKVRKTVGNRGHDEQDPTLLSRAGVASSLPNIEMGSAGADHQNGHTSGRVKRKTRIVSDDDDFEPDPSSPKPIAISPLPPSASHSHRPNGKISIKSKGKGVKVPKNLPPIPARDLSASSLKAEASITDCKLSQAHPEGVVLDDTMTPNTPVPLSTDDPSGIPQLATVDVAPVQKKRKLPNIKKKSILPGTSPAPPAVPALLPSEVPLPLPITLPRKPTTVNGSGDFDLRDPDTYTNLFKDVGVPKKTADANRGIMTRKEKEEARQRELNQMRDTARLRRGEANTNTFDLQSQSKMIARFEELLRRKKLLASPHILAAGFGAAPSAPT